MTWVEKEADCGGQERTGGDGRQERAADSSLGSLSIHWMAIY